ncbi:MAG: hypothetical protein IM537_22170 [Pseudanabaena sp. M57BS1SP1A06MG]|nr:hypothetical protein [Pseudanabaena sp. M57BS1SP1A06MG]
MNPKTILWSLLALIILLPSTWFAWSIYQRSENEKLLNSVSTIMSESNKDDPASMEALQAKIKDLDTAIAIMQSVPPSAKELYQQAQANLSKLQNRKEKLLLILETELNVQQELDKAEALAIEAVNIGAKPRNTAKEWNEAYGKWQEAIGVLQRTPKSRFINSQVQKNLTNYQESASVASTKVSGEQQAIDLLNRAKSLADQAVKIAQNPPHSTETWAIAYGKWQEAVDLLEKIPASTSVTAESKRLLNEYKKNRNIILNEYRKRENLEIQAKQESEFESFFVGLSSSTKDSLRRLKALGYARERFTSLCFQIITDNTTSADLAGRGFELTSYASGICNYVWDRL